MIHFGRQSTSDDNIGEFIPHWNVFTFHTFHISLIGSSRYLFHVSVFCIILQFIWLIFVVNLSSNLVCLHFVLSIQTCNFVYICSLSLFRVCIQKFVFSLLSSFVFAKFRRFLSSTISKGFCDHKLEVSFLHSTLFLQINMRTHTHTLQSYAPLVDIAYTHAPHFIHVLASLMFYSDQCPQCRI